MMRHALISMDVARVRIVFGAVRDMIGRKRTEAALRRTKPIWPKGKG